MEFISSLFEESEVDVIVPTFSYSFCNKESYDVNETKSAMGSFSEHFRKLPGRYRTLDPLLSVSVPESMKVAFEHPGDNSLGKNSALDTLHNLKNVKFLFFGAEMAECFTYVHYVEKMMDVPYRFDMSFEGDMIDHSGKKLRKTQSIHTQCYGVKLPQKYEYFEKEMEEKGFLLKKKIGDKYIACIAENDAYREIRSHIEADINYYLEQPFRDEDLIHRYVYSTDNGRITHC